MSSNLVRRLFIASVTAVLAAEMAYNCSILVWKVELFYALFILGAVCVLVLPKTDRSGREIVAEALFVLIAVFVGPVARFLKAGPPSFLTEYSPALSCKAPSLEPKPQSPAVETKSIDIRKLKVL